MPTMRYSLAWGLLLLISVALLAGCGGEAAPAADATTDAAAGVTAIPTSIGPGLAVRVADRDSYSYLQDLLPANWATLDHLPRYEMGFEETLTDIQTCTYTGNVTATRQNLTLTVIITEREGGAEVARRTFVAGPPEPCPVTISAGRNRWHGSLPLGEFRAWLVELAQQLGLPQPPAVILPLAALDLHAAVRNLSLRPAGDLLAATDGDGVVHILRTVPFRAENSDFHLALTTISDADFSPDGQHLVTTEQADEARIWLLTDLTVEYRLREHTDTVRSAHYSPDGSRVVTASDDHSFRLWDAASGDVLRVVEMDNVVHNAIFSPDGARIATGSSGGVVQVWDGESGDLLLALDAGPQSVRRLAFSPDGTRLATVGDDGVPRVWDAVSGELLLTLTASAQQITNVAYSPDGSLLLTVGGPDDLAHLWDAATGSEVAQLAGHTDFVWDAVFSPDGRRVYTGSGDETVRVWDVSGVGQ
ncbi:MAG: WD40 repeat domain-containing protein [Anaerolineae bacterium]|nr:WD40 repeat domain-containing protein [Anaerolineae bacterium]